jgi:hypothetical protein
MADDILGNRWLTRREMKYYLDFMGARAVSLNSSIVFLGRFNRNSTGAMY